MNFLLSMMGFLMITFSPESLLAEGGFAPQGGWAVPGNQEERSAELKRTVDFTFSGAYLAVLGIMGFGVAAGQFEYVEDGAFALVGVQCSDLFANKLIKRATK